MRTESFCVGRVSGPCDRAQRDSAFCVFFWDATPMLNRAVPVRPA